MKTVLGELKNGEVVSEASKKCCVVTLDMFAMRMTLKLSKEAGSEVT